MRAHFQRPARISPARSAIAMIVPTGCAGIVILVSILDSSQRVN